MNSRTGSTDSPRATVAAAFGLALVLAAAVLGGCRAQGPHDADGPGFTVVQPQRDWSDAVVYFVLLDRFADGDPANNLDHQPRQSRRLAWRRPAVGLREQLDEIASLGATAIWINPVQRQIDAGLPVNPIPEAGVQRLVRALGFSRLLDR
jgi:hypothetical protein